MKYLYIMKYFFHIITLVLLIGITFSSCKTPEVDQPKDDITNFLDLTVSESFTFESFNDLQTTIQLASTKASGMEIIQIYDAHPNNGGKLILSGAADEQGVFNLPIRIASRLTEVYIAKLSSSGQNEYVAVPVNGSVIEFSFAATKTVETTIDWCDCEDDEYLNNNFHADLTIEDGETYCVAEGDFVHIKKLNMESGATLNVCGSVLIDKFQSANSGQFSGGFISVSPAGDITIKQGGIPVNIDNYGSLDFTSKKASITGALHNYGEVSSTVEIDITGSIINDGSFTTSDKFDIKDDGSLINNCQFYVTINTLAPLGGSDQDFKQEGSFINNGYLKVDDKLELKGSGNKKTTLGLGSLIDCGEFKIEGDVVGPLANGSQSQITAEDDSETKNNSDISGYVDLWVKNNNEIDPNEGDKTDNVTYHDYTVTAPDCGENVAPAINSSLQIGGLVNEPITPYVITATGTAPIDYDATNLPEGLSYNTANHTISGTPSAAGTFEIGISASNFMGDDNEILVLIVTQPTQPPVISSSLTASATVDQSFNYTLTATGTGPITYNAINLPAGLSFNTTTHKITGMPEEAGTYYISLNATNGGGTTTEILTLTVGTPPIITSALTASGTQGDQFVTYTFTAEGLPDISYSVTNVPEGLSYNPDNRTINGTPTFAGVTNVTLQASNDYGTDIQTLVITVIEGLQPPVITSVLTASGMKDFPFSFTITATGSEPMTFAAINLPAGLTISGSVIAGIPTVAGTYNIPISATNNAGVDDKILVLVLGSDGASDTDGDGIADNLDAYPLDGTRAFNSFYPDEVDYASIAFEDLWPAYGDYDFNDFVVNLNYKMVTNAQNEMVDVIIKYQIMADGASLENGFGLVFNAPPSSVESVTGCLKFGNAIVLDQKGYEAGHTNQVVIFPIDNINTIMEGGMANTIPGGKYIQTTVNTVTTHFSTPQASIGSAPFNPFIFVDQDRGHEIHLKDQPPTAYVDTEFFGTDSDASVPSEGKYYRSSNGLVWGIETPVNFNYPIEKADILTAHLKFAAWAQSSGDEYPDWYLNNSGYRNDENIYVIPE